MRESALERYAVNLAVGCEVAVSYLFGVWSVHNFLIEKVKQKRISNYHAVVRNPDENKANSARTPFEACVILWL